MLTTPTQAEDFSYFHDAIHGRVSFLELPPAFLAPLRVALNSPFLNRLTRISQLGHTSLTFFSATQTRFSHAVGTLVMMNRIIGHLWGRDHDQGLPSGIMDAVRAEYPRALGHGGNEQVSLRCHLLLAALMQDVGELPFQKITSHYFQPTAQQVASLSTRVSTTATPPDSWKVKDVFNILCLSRLLQEAALSSFDLKFLTFLIIEQSTSQTPALLSLRQMLNGVLDSDRLDYVYRDAHLTIGSLCHSDAVIRTIVQYEPNGVVVDDPHPVADFLTTRARLWSFVYSSPSVRFRQALLKSFLQAAFCNQHGAALLRDHGLPADLSLDLFVDLDDHSMLASIRRLETDSQKRLSMIDDFGQSAREILLKQGNRIRSAKAEALR